VGISRRRIAVVLMTVGLMAGAWRPCAGWKPTPEARMSCCMRKADCAKHKSAGGSGHAPHRQSDADACCAASERPDASPSLLTVVVPPTFVPLAGPFAEPPSVPARWFDSRRPPPLVAERRLPRHLLLSVFVI